MSAAQVAIDKYGARPAKMIAPWVLGIVDRWMRNHKDAWVGPDAARKDALAQLQEVPPALRREDPLETRSNLVMHYDWLTEELQKVWADRGAARNTAVREVLMKILGEQWKKHPLPKEGALSKFVYDCLGTTAETVRRARRYVYETEAEMIEAQAEGKRRRGDNEGALRYENLVRGLRNRRPGRPSRRRRK
jgi:hypothetical protein